MDANQWLAAFAQRLGVTPPTPRSSKHCSTWPRVAAHSSERIAAPVACWMTARAGLTPADALAIAREPGDE